MPFIDKKATTKNYARELCLNTFYDFMQNVETLNNCVPNKFKKMCAE